jgi:outer membrane protein assembly factor BamB
LPAALLIIGGILVVFVIGGGALAWLLFATPTALPKTVRIPVAATARAVTAKAPPVPVVRNVERSGSDWPGFLGPAGNGTSPEKGIVSPWPNEGLPVVWHTPVGNGYPAPTISQGRLFIFDRVRDDARLRCLKATTGEQLWQFTYPTDFVDGYGYENGPRCCPVVDGDRVYIFGPEGMLHCLRTKDGDVLWKLETSAKFGVRMNFFGVGSTPVVDGDLLIVQIGGSTPDTKDMDIADVKPDGTGVVALDKKTGEIKWKAGSELASYSSPVLATIGDRRWCFVFARGGLLGLEPQTGKVDFHFPWRARSLESVNASNPVVVDDRVLVTECYGPGAALVQIKPGGYKMVWNDADKGRDKSLQCHWNTPIYHEGYVYGSSARHEPQAELRCVEFATGKVMWSKPGLGRCSLTMVDGHFICHSESGELYLLKVNPKQYEEVSQMIVRDPDRNRVPLLRAPCWASPVVSHGLLYVRGRGHLVCLDLMP